MAKKKRCESQQHCNASEVNKKTRNFTVLSKSYRNKILQVKWWVAKLNWSFGKKSRGPSNIDSYLKIPYVRKPGK